MIDDGVVYLPVSSDSLPLIAALYITEEMTPSEKSDAARRRLQSLQQIAPASMTLTGRLPDPAHGKTILYVCHSKQTLDEALSLSATRPVIVWAWLLDEELVAEALLRVPVVTGPQNTPAAMQRLQSLRPSEPDPDAENDSDLCHALEHAWSVPSIDLRRINNDQRAS